MAGTKYFYVGTYVEGDTPGEPSEYYNLIWQAQKAFKSYFSTQQEETDAVIMFTENYTDYASTKDAYPMNIGTRSGTGNNSWGGLPTYCENLVYTSLAWERNRGTITFAHNNYYDAPLNIAPYDLNHGSITVRGITFYHNPPSSGNSGNNACVYLSASAETTVIPIVFENCRFGFYGTVGGSGANFTQHNKAIHTFNGEALLIFKACVFICTGSDTSGQCVNVSPPSGYTPTQPFAVFFGCGFHGGMNGQLGGAITVGSASAQATHDAMLLGVYNSYICSNYYQGVGRTVVVNSNCEFVNCTFADKLYYDGRFNPSGSGAGYSFEYSTSHTSSTVHPTLKNCSFIGSSPAKGNQASLVNVVNCQTLVTPTAQKNTSAEYQSLFGAPPTTTNGYWLIDNGGNTGEYVRCNPNAYAVGDYHKFLYFGMPIVGGKLENAGTMDVFTDPRILGYFGTSYPNFLTSVKIHKGFQNALANDTPTHLLDEEFYNEYKRVRGSSIDIGMVEYMPYYCILSVSPDYTAEDEGFGTTKFNSIPDAITYYVQNHQGVDYTGCKVVVEKDMAVSAFDWTSALQLTSATQMFVICGRRAKPLVRNPQVKLTISSSSTPMFNLDDCIATGSVPDGIEFRDIEFVCNQSNPSHGQSAKAIELTDDCEAKLLLTRCKFSSENPVSMYLRATCDSTYAQNQPSRIIVDNCAFNGPAIVLRTDGTNNVAFVNTTFDLTGYESGSAVTISGASSVVQRFYNCGFWNCPSLSSNKDFEMWNTFVFKSANDGWTSGSKFTNCATDLASFGSATATSCKYGLNPNNQFVSSGRYGGLKFFPKEGSDLITGATDDVLKDMSIYVYGGMMPEQYDPIGTGRPDR